MLRARNASAAAAIVITWPSGKTVTDIAHCSDAVTGNVSSPRVPRAAPGAAAAPVVRRQVTGNVVFPVTAGSDPLGPGGRAMARNLGLDAVVDHFTLIGDEL